MKRVLVVDDQRRMRRVLQIMLEQLGMESVAAESAEEGLEALTADRFDLVLTDLRMPGMDGLAFLARLREENPDLPVVLLTAHGTIATAVEAMRLGASDFLTRPFELETLEIVIARAFDHVRTRSENRFLREEVERASSFGGLVGSAPVMRSVFELIEQVAATKSPVLVTGETGTGKELVARAIHDRSPRAEKLFVPINCTAIPAELMESELFGHVRGAFTGATSNRTGKLALADGGTLFLDEIGDMDVRLQAKLLRVLQEGVVDPVGSNRSFAVDLRIVSATNGDLAESIRRGAFREDLLYRLNVFHVEIPRLADRGGDVVELAATFLARLGAEVGRPDLELDPGAAEVLEAYPWPGNVRELRNVMERAAVLSRERIVGPTLLRSLLPAVAPTGEAATGDPDTLDLETTVADAERRVILRALAASETKGAAAKVLGIGERTLWAKLKKYGL